MSKSNTNKLGYLYRYHDENYSLGIDEYDNPILGSNVQVNVTRYRIVKITAKGVWIKDDWPFLDLKWKRFVNPTTKKQFACITKELALESFKARKTRQIAILKTQLEQAEMAYSLSKHVKIEY